MKIQIFLFLILLILAISYRIINNYFQKILENLVTTLPILQELTVLNNHELEASKHINFIKQNSRLTKIKTRLNNANSLLFETIHNLKFLRYWSIRKYRYDYGSFKIYNFPPNYSIKTLKLWRCIGGKNAIELIYACKSLEFVEFKEWEFYNGDEINWARLDRRINIIKFYMCDFYHSIIQHFDGLQIFNLAIFIIEDNAEDLINQLSSDKMINYKLFPIISEDQCFSTIIKTIKLIKP
jgi:hypothetical protein